MTRIVDDQQERVAASDLRPGDRFLVPKGAVIAVDAALDAGATALLDESLLTGESVAARRGHQERIRGGCINVGEPLTMVALAAVGDSTLASMVRQDDQLPALVARFRDIEQELVRAGVSIQTTVEAHALECVACPGSPAEVVDIVASLAGQLAAGRQSERGDVAIAVAFAKRFAF